MKLTLSDYLTALAFAVLFPAMLELAFRLVGM